MCRNRSRWPKTGRLWSVYALTSSNRTPILKKHLHLWHVLTATTARERVWSGSLEIPSLTTFHIPARISRLPKALHWRSTAQPTHLKSPAIWKLAQSDFLEGAPSVNAALFNLQRTNIKNTDPSNPGLSINSGTQRTNGLELSANGRLPGRWDISAGYSYLDGKMVQSLATINSHQLPATAGCGGICPGQGALTHTAPFSCFAGHKNTGWWL